MKSKKKYNTNNKPCKRTICIILPIIALVLAAAGCLGMTMQRAKPYIQTFETQAGKIKAEMDKSDIEYASIALGTPDHVVLISISDGTEQARVFSGTGKSMDQAWHQAVRKADVSLVFDPMTPLWVKGDIVISSQIASQQGVSGIIEALGNGAFRYGIAFDKKYSSALLDTQVLASGAVSEDVSGIQWSKLGKYAEKSGIHIPKEIPKTVVLFQTTGWIFDSRDETVSELYENTGARGSRILHIEDLTADDIRSLVLPAMAYVARTTASDGRMQYLYYPGIGIEPDDYNIIRHAGTLWAMVEEYKASKDQQISDAAKRAAKWLKDQAVSYSTGEGVLFVEDGNITLGCSGLSLVALSRYIEVLGVDDVVTIQFCKNIADGIIALQEEDGSFQQVLNTDFSKGDKFITPYYDGEASFGLTLFYGVTKDERYLDAAKLSAENYLANNYLSYVDHWASYFMSELTKYVDDPRYYEFAMRNIMDNLNLFQARAFSPYRLEMIVACYEAYQRMAEREIEIDYAVDTDSLWEAIQNCAETDFINYMGPEVAMYMAQPLEVEGTFFGRDNDGIYLRNDINQHSVVGLLRYAKLRK